MGMAEAMLILASLKTGKFSETKMQLRYQMTSLYNKRTRVSRRRIAQFVTSTLLHAHKSAQRMRRRRKLLGTIGGTEHMGHFMI